MYVCMYVCIEESMPFLCRQGKYNITNINFLQQPQDISKCLHSSWFAWLWSCSLDFVSLFLFPCLLWLCYYIVFLIHLTACSIYTSSNVN